MTKIDIKDAFLHVPINPRFQRLLAFRLQNQLYFFQALPFGLNTAPWVFMRLLKHPIRVLASQGVRFLAYLDDIILWSSTRRSCCANTRLTITTLQNLGFIINQKKSVLNPSQSIDWLGLLWNSLDGNIQLTPDYTKSLVTLATSAANDQTLTLVDLQRLQGKMAFAGQISPRCRHQTLNFAPFLQQANHPTQFTTFPPPPDLRKALLWWTQPTNLLTPQTLQNPPPSVFLWTDASSLGYGAHSIDNGWIQGSWDDQTQLLHINALELLTVLLTLRSHLTPEKTSVGLHVDSMVALYCLRNHGSKRSPTLQQIYSEILTCLEEKQVYLTVSYLPSFSNALADALSRKIILPTEYRMDHHYTQLLPHTPVAQPPGDRHDGNNSKHSTPPIHIPLTEPSGNSHRLFPPGHQLLDGNLHFPPSSPSFKGFTPPDPLRGSQRDCRTLVCHSPLVSRTAPAISPMASPRGTPVSENQRS